MKRLLLSVLLLVFSIAVLAQKDDKDSQIIEDAQTAKKEFVKQDPSMNELFSSAHAYVIFPNVGKGGLGVGGAAGNGAAYYGGSLVGLAKLTQVSIGFQAGGQAYREVIFFENADTFNRFKANKVELSAQVSAVAAASGATADAKYVEGVMVFTMQKGGLMYEASVGGQKFKFRKL
jgi:lipid-binding SYLF domain-containing protein